jgi:hypothetical protein
MINAVNVRREVICARSGIAYVVRAVPIGRIDTGDLRWSPVVGTRRLSMYVESFGWLRNRLRFGGRWAVVAGVVGANGSPDRLVHSVSVADRNAAYREFSKVRRMIERGEMQ